MHGIIAATAALALGFALASGAATATVAPTRTAQEQPADPAEYAAKLVQEAFDETGRNRTGAAQAKLELAFHSSGFAQLPANLRYRALLVACMIAYQDGQGDKAHELAERATSFDEADDRAWMIRLSSAFDIKNYPDAAQSVIVMAQRWPARLADVYAPAIMQLHRELTRAQHTGADRDMLDALFEAGWRNEDVEPSGLWRDLALLHVEHHDIARATAVALRIDSAQTALSMRVDKRFDAITAGHRQAFDVDRLIASEIAAAQARMRAHPDQLKPVTDLQGLLLLTRQYARVLSISDAAIEHSAQGDGSTTYTDFSDRYNWILDNRSRALTRMGRFDEAVRVEVLAARRPEHGAMNVSQLINLANLQAELQRPDKAAGVIVELGQMSPYGRMQLESVRLKIAIVAKDKAATDHAMAYLRTHRADAIATWQDALLLDGDLDAAAALLIERLEKPAWRNDALVAMQHYAEITETPLERLTHDRWNTITARVDVQTAMQKVGRVETFGITTALQ
ncbi:MAG: hypothetical protein ACTHJO_05990 [Rhodanobacter sp.]